MKRLRFSILILVLVSCSSEEKKSLQGDWQFLDKFGNYNEAFFGDSTYLSINRFVVKDNWYQYTIRNDSLYSTVNKRFTGLRAVAGLEWIGSDRVVLSSEFSRDTMIRIKNSPATISKAKPFSDSAIYFQAFFDRYERFLIFKGILSEEEVKRFREKGEVPEDVLENNRGFEN